MTRKYITPERIKSLEDSIGWASNYKGPDEGIYHFVGTNINTELALPTKKLIELGKLNRKREQLIKELTRVDKVLPI